MSRAAPSSSFPRRRESRRFISWIPACAGMTVVCALLLSVGLAHAEVSTPKIPKGKGDQCVEETPFMRRNHMEVILHQRDETVHNGIRSKKHSLKNCLNCHAVNDERGQPVAFTDPRHFCTVCHSFASVSIDCFECHSSKPEPQPAVAQP